MTNEWGQTLQKIGATFNYLIVHWIPLSNHQKESTQEKNNNNEYHGM